MPLKTTAVPKTGGAKRADPLEPGVYPARVVQIIDLGLQEQKAFKGDEKPPRYMLYVTYEILDEFLKDEDGNDIEDKPRWISEKFALHPLDSDLATSTKRYLALDPAVDHGGDWAQLLGKPCMLTVTNFEYKGSIRDKVSSISSMRPKEAKNAPALVNDPKMFDTSEPDMEVLFSLPQFLQDLITKENLDYPGSRLEKAVKGYKKPEKKEEPDNDHHEEDVVDDSEENEDW